MKYRFIAVEGNIGVGKTTLAAALASRTGAKLMLEQFAHNPLLPAFYANPATHAFPLELSFLADRCEQLQNICSDREEMIISDYLIDKSLIFARNNLPVNEFELFGRIYRQMTTSLPKPDLVIFLHSSITQLQQNIKKRGRSFEQEISDDYLKNIEHSYHSYFETLTIPIRIFRMDDLSSLNNFEEIDFLLNGLQ